VSTDVVWGRAGQRLSPTEAQARRQRRAREAYLSRERRAADDRQARAGWEAGHLQPWRITQALDAAGLEGPEVDAQCLAVEPEVDMWEAGTLYPTWEQLCALAELTGCTPRFFVGTFHSPLGEQLDGPTMSARDSSLRFHVTPAEWAELDREPVLTYPPHVVRQRMSGEPIALPEPPPAVRPGEQVPLLAEEDLPPAPPAPEPMRLPPLRPGELPECTGDCGRPMRRDVWLRQRGRCSRCGPA